MKVNAYSSAGYYADNNNRVREAEILIQYTFKNVSTEDVLVITIPATAGCEAAGLEINVSPF